MRTTDKVTDKQRNYLDALSKDLVTLSVTAKAESLAGADAFAATAQDVVDTLARYDEDGDLTKANASKAIDFLVTTNRELKAKLAAHRKTSTATLTTTGFAAPKRDLDKSDAGMYTKPDGSIIRVYFGQQSGQMLAKKVVEKGTNSDGTKRYGFEYLGLAARFTGGAVKMSLDDAKKWGKATGTCCVCARRLDVPESVDAGIGPVCARKF